MKIIFDDSTVKESLWPLTATRNAADIRVGILTIREKWELLFTGRYRSLPARKAGSDQVPVETVTINPSIIPSKQTEFSINDHGVIEIHNEKETCKTIQYPGIFFRSTTGLYEMILYSSQQEGNHKKLLPPIL